MLTLEQIDALVARAVRVGYLGLPDVRALADHGRTALALAEAELSRAKDVTVYIDAEDAIRWAR